jgi:hypothetical protein
MNNNSGSGVIDYNQLIYGLIRDDKYDEASELLLVGIVLISAMCVCESMNLTHWTIRTLPPFDVCRIETGTMPELP